MVEILAKERPEDEHGGVTLTSYWSGSKRGRNSSQSTTAAYKGLKLSMAVWRWPLIGRALNVEEILANERPEDEHGGVGGGVLPQASPASTEGAQHRLSGILVLW